MNNFNEFFSGLTTDHSVYGPTFSELNTASVEEDQWRSKVDSISKEVVKQAADKEEARLPLMRESFVGTEGSAEEQTKVEMEEKCRGAPKLYDITTLGYPETVCERIYELSRTEEMEMLSDSTPFLDEIQGYKSMWEVESTASSDEDGAVRMPEVSAVTEQRWKEFREQQKIGIDETMSSSGEGLLKEESSSLGKKLLKLAKGTGAVAGAVIVAPVALAAVGAASVYEHVVKDDRKHVSVEAPSSTAFEHPADALLAGIQQTEIDFGLRNHVNILEDRQQKEESPTSMTGICETVSEDEATSRVPEDILDTDVFVQGSAKGETSASTEEIVKPLEVYVTDDEATAVQLQGRTMSRYEDWKERKEACTKVASAESELAESRPAEEQKSLVEFTETATGGSEAGSEISLEEMEGLKKEVRLPALSVHERPESTGEPEVTKTRESEIKVPHGVVTMYQLNVDGTRQPFPEHEFAELESKPFSMEAEHPYEMSANISWTPEEAEGEEADLGKDIQLTKGLLQKATEAETPVSSGLIPERQVAQITEQFFSHLESGGEVEHEVMPEKERLVQLETETPEQRKSDSGVLFSTPVLQLDEQLAQPHVEAVAEEAPEDDMTWPGKELSEAAVVTTKAMEHDSHGGIVLDVAKLVMPEADIGKEGSSYVWREHETKVWETKIPSMEDVEKRAEPFTEARFEEWIRGRIAPEGYQEKSEAPLTKKDATPIDMDLEARVERWETESKQPSEASGIGDLIKEKDFHDELKTEFDSHQVQEEVLAARDLTEVLEGTDVLPRREEPEEGVVNAAPLDVIEDRPATPERTESITGVLEEQGSSDMHLQQIHPSEDKDVQEGNLSSADREKLFGIGAVEESTSKREYPIVESLLGFTKSTGKVVGGVIAAPVALAALGTAAAAQMVTEWKAPPTETQSGFSESTVLYHDVPQTTQKDETLTTGVAEKKSSEEKLEPSPTINIEVPVPEPIRKESYEDWQRYEDDRKRETTVHTTQPLSVDREEHLEEQIAVAHEQTKGAAGEEEKMSPGTMKRITCPEVPGKITYETEPPVKGDECHEVELSRCEEVEESAPTLTFSAMFPKHADTDAKFVKEEKSDEQKYKVEPTKVLDAAVEQERKLKEEGIVFDQDDLLTKGKLPEREELVYATQSIEKEAKAEKKLTSEDVSEEMQQLADTQPSARQKSGKISSEEDETTKIADGEGVAARDYDQVLSEQLISEILGEIDQTTSKIVGSSSSSEASSSSEEQGTTGKYSSQVEHEPEVDYQSDLMEKLEMLAQQTRQLEAPVEEGTCEEELNVQVAEMVDDILKKLGDSLSRSESTYKTATATSRDGYETCLTSQEDTFETATGWHSQDSEYTTATSEVSSRLSERSEERRGSATPIAMLSPVQSDRLFTASQDEEQEPTRRVSPYSDSKRSSPDMPDIELVPDEDEEEIEGMLLTSSSGILLAPDIDPGRPISPVPPGVNDDDEGIVVLATPDGSRRIVESYKITEQVRPAEIKILDSIVEAPGDDMLAEETALSWTRATDAPERTTSQESIHEKAMEVEKEYLRQYSDVSSGSKAETVVDRMDKESEVTTDALLSETMPRAESDSPDSLDKISIRSGSSGKRYSTSRRSSTSSKKSTHDEPQTFVERLTPELKMTWTETDQPGESPKRSPFSPSEEYPTYLSEAEQIVHPVEVELETVDEEPEEVDSLNGRSASSNGLGTDISAVVGKYKTTSSDNVSETSLQEFERIERDVLNKGESSLSGSEMELYVAGKLKAADGSTSSLAEFERLEQEVVAEGSPQEEVMMLSDIREESEVEEMSIRDDDEEERDSIPEIQAIPVGEDTQLATPLASPTDSIDRDFEKVIPEVLETSTDSLEVGAPTTQLVSGSCLTGYEVVDDKVHDGVLHDSLELIPQDKDSLLEGASIQELTSQDTQALLSGDTAGTFQEYQDEEKDSLAGDLDTMFGDYPTTLTTFETTQIRDDGSTEVISRRVLTRVTDPVISHVQFTGTENERRVRDLEREEEFETVDAEGNVTRTTLHRGAPSSSAGIFSSFL